MSKAVINFKIDVEVKREAKKIAQELGIPLSAIVNSQLRQLIRTRAFELNATPVMTPQLEAVIAEVESDHRVGRNITRTKNIKEALKHLDSL